MISKNKKIFWKDYPYISEPTRLELSRLESNLRSFQEKNQFEENAEIFQQTIEEFDRLIRFVEYSDFIGVSADLDRQTNAGDHKKREES